MTCLQRGRGSPRKWLFAGMLVALAMAFSVTSVSAFCFPPNAGGARTNFQFGSPGSYQHPSRDLVEVPVNQVPTGAVPEPTTILLLAGGLGVAFWKRARFKV
jgi:hypothetical protein